MPQHRLCAQQNLSQKRARAALVKRAREFGIKASFEGADINRVMERVRAVIASIAPHDSRERFISLGVDVIYGEAAFIDNHTVTAGEKTLTAKYIIIASGSKPLVPPVPGLNSIPYLTNENIFDIKTLPKHLVVLGGGPIGLELGQGFRYLGSEVSVIDLQPSLFHRDDPEVGPLMENIMSGEGIDFNLGAKVTGVRAEGAGRAVSFERGGINKEVSGDAVLVALGRTADTKGLGLEKAGVKTDTHGYIPTDAHMRTNVKNIFACGDATGPFQFTHMAGYQAGIVVRNIILPFPARADYSSVPWATFTIPEAAHVGYTETWAKQEGLFREAVKYRLAENDRAKSEGDTDGFIKLVLGKGGGL